MKVPALLLSAAAAVSAVPRSLGDFSHVMKRANGTFTFTGVSEACGEFGNTALPGQLDKDYTWPSQSAISTLIGTGMNTFRIPMMMERAIPTKMTGTLNSTYFSGLKSTVDFVTGKGAYAIIDPHNFGRYYGEVISSASDFGAWWKTIATEFADNDLVIFDTNNEYHDMDNQLVADLNQAAIDAIRAAGATTQYIFVEGNSWSGAWHWVSSGTATSMAALTDPQDRIVYEMHQYLDSDGSGTSEACVSSTIGQERIQEATQWLKDNGKKGIIGETAGGSNDQCKAAITGMLQYMQENSDVWSGWLWWSAGPWWADYMYSMEPPNGPAYTGFLPTIQTFI